MDRRGQLLTVTDNLGKLLGKAVDDGQKTFQTGGLTGFLAEFHKREYTFSPLYLLALYYETLKGAGVKNRAELEREWEKYSQDDDMQGCVRAVLQAEEGYHKLLAQVDILVQREDDEAALPTSEICTVGSRLPGHLALLDPISGDLVTLESVWKQSPYTLFVLMRHLA